MSMLDRRLQVLIDEDRWARLEQEAIKRKVSISTLVREAIDDRYPSLNDLRRTALQAALNAQPLAVPDLDDLRRELDEVRTGLHS